MLGILLVDKPAGLTSHDVVNRVRRVMGTKRVGHSGTLDPMAEGLLVVAIGAATRFLQYLPLEPKEYVATIRFGQSTDSYDKEGEITEERPVPADLLSRATEAARVFDGLIRQVPPMYSAVKVQGKPLYAYAREGKELVREARTVHIGRFALTRVDAHTLAASIECSGGTYVRSLAHDLGQAMGCGAHLIALERTRVGRFSRSQAHGLDVIEGATLVPLEDALRPMPMLALELPEIDRVRHGMPVRRPDTPDAAHVALLDTRGRVFAIARAGANGLQPECVIPAEVMPDVVGA